MHQNFKISYSVAWESNKRVVLNKSMYTGKKCQKLKRVYTFIWYTRVGKKECPFLRLLELRMLLIKCAGVAEGVKYWGC